MSDTPRRHHLFLIGAAAGLAFADLLLGLNPGLLDPGRAVRLFFGCCAVGLLLAAPAAVRRSEATTSRPGWLALGTGAAAFGLYVEAQRQLHYLFLGNGTRRLLVATSLVSAVVALAWYGAAIFRPGRRGTRALLAFPVLLLSMVPLVGRRAPGREGLTSRATVPRTPSRGLLVIGVEGASWELLTSGASDGSLPVLARLLRDGVAGPLGTLAPYDRDSAWISAATGKRPSKHGVVSDRRFDTPFGSFNRLPRFRHGEPLASLPLSTTIHLGGAERRSLAFWEILSARGHEAAVLNWPAAPPHDGLLLWAPESMFDPNSPRIDGRPEKTARRAALFRVGVDRLDRYLVSSLQPRGLPQVDARRVRALEGAARDLSVAGATLAALPSGAGSVSALVLSGLATPARVYGPSANPSRYWGVPARESDARARALVGYYRFLDELIGDLMEREGTDRTVCVFSPIGYGPPAPSVAAARFLLGREPEAVPDPGHSGFVILSGSGIREGVRLTSANLFDLAPTLLALAGAPVARDFDGRVLAEAFDERFAETTSIPIVLSFEPGGPQ